MKRYAGYKPSSVLWIGEIPSHWNLSVVKNGYNTVLGKMLCSDKVGPLDTYENYMCAANIKWLGVNTEVSKQMWFSPIEKEQYLLQEGDVLIMEGGTAGTACIYHGEFAPCFIQNSVHKCTAKSGNLNTFLYYWLYASFYAGYVDSICNKATIQHYTSEKLANTPIAFPPVNEQAAIVEYLDTKVSKINSLIDEAKASIEEYKSWRASIIYEAVTKGLDKDVEMKDSGFEWIGYVPAHWQLIQNKHVMRKHRRICGTYKGQDIISLTMNGVTIRDLGAGGKMPTTFDGYQFVYPGELLMCLFDIDVTPRCVGRVYNEGLTSPAYSCFVLNDGMNLDYYYYYYLMMDNTKELLHLAKNLRHSLTEEQLGQIKVPVPPVEEQIQIGKVLDEKTRMIDSLVSEKESLISDLETYKKSLIFEVVTGKRKVV